MPSSNEPHPLGISVYCLRNTLLQDVRDAGMDEKATVYEIEDLREKEKFGVIRRKGANVKCPRDNEIGAAYVNCLRGVDNVGPANRMLSYVWGYTVGEIITSLEDYCHQKGLCTKRLYIWICCLCNNQHRFKDEVPFETLYDTFKGKVVGVGHILALMTPWDKPQYLERVWCIFEMHTANSAANVTIEVIMPPKEKNNMMEDLEDYNKLVEALMGTRIENAKASFKSDRENIMRLVNSTAGGAPALNNSVNALLRACFQDMILAAVDDYGTMNDVDMSTDLTYAVQCCRVGRVMKESNNYDQALELYEKALAIQEKVYGEEHTETAVSYNYIALVMRSKGDLDGALTMHHKALAVRERVLGEEHTDTAESYNNIALLMEDMGDLDGALTMNHKALAVYEKVHGEEHKDTAESFNNIASVMQQKGDLDGSLTMHQKVLAVREMIYGEEHIATAQSYNNIAMIMEKRGDLDGALTMNQKALVVYEKVHGEGHTYTLITYSLIGRVMHKKGDLDGALTMHQKVLAVREKIYGEEHRSTAQSYNNIAMIMQERGDLDGALTMYHKALTVEERILGEEHMDTAMTYSYIASVMQEKGDLDGALMMHHKALAVRKKVLGEEHKDTATSYCNIALVMQEKGDLEMFTKTLNVEEKVYGKDHKETIATKKK